MAEIRWKSFAKASPDREYLALISYLPLKRFWMIPKFLIYMRAIQNQLRESRGLIGYSLLAHFLQRRFWTLSVWEDEKALMEFVRNVPHSRVMVALRSHMDKTKFVEWKIKGSAVPVTWEEGFRLLQTG
jgi:hypothetical protein